MICDKEINFLCMWWTIKAKKISVFDGKSYGAGLSNGFRFTSKLIKVHGNFQSEVSLRSNMKAFWGRIWKKKEDEHYSRFDILKGLEACLARRWNNSDRDKWPQVVEKKGSLNFLPLKLSNVLSDEFVLLCGVLEQELGLSWGFLYL